MSRQLSPNQPGDSKESARKEDYRRPSIRKQNLERSLNDKSSLYTMRELYIIINSFN